MKKRVLSALLALSTLLITTPAAYAAEPATQSGGAEIDWPEPTCTVDYKPQSDTVSCEFVEETGDAPVKLVYSSHAMPGSRRRTTVACRATCIPRGRHARSGPCSGP